MKKQKIDRSDTGKFFIDYLAFGTDILTDFVQSEMLTTFEYSSNRFYKVAANCKNSYIQSERRILLLNKLSVRLNKEYLYSDSIYSDGLPLDAKIQRIDFAINTETKEEAFECLMFGAIGKMKDGSNMYFESETGETYYFGNRTGTFFERIYFLIERGVWRYELEFKPRAGRKNKKFEKAHKDIQALWRDVCDLMYQTGIECPDELPDVPKFRRDWIDVHIDSPFVPASLEFYNIGLKNDKERQYFKNRLIYMEDKSRVFEWDIILKLF